ncbi:MAG: Gfo/Idh/MocA family oxidoreductase [Lachnospiraceae bacterium]|nr:Gfo/Idh/MocA family oxidoreductase [Lachnospiraceae bacterium]
MYKAAVLGLGRIGLLYEAEPQRPHPSTHVAAYEMSEGFELVCGIDGDPSKEALLKDAAPRAAYFPSLEEAMAAGALKDIDVVSICTPPDTHLPLVRRLLQAGTSRILFCEKPLTEDTGEAKELLRAVTESGVTLIPNISRRWNTGLRRVTELLRSGEIGELQKIHVRYTRGIRNTGSHLFDLLHMWTGSPIAWVETLGETPTSAEPEPTLSFAFALENGVTGYAEGVDDRQYYLFDIDLYCSRGKVEMRCSGDEILVYGTGPHHLFQGFGELRLQSHETGLLQDACMGNAVENIRRILGGTDTAYCELSDAIYPLYVAEALERSRISQKREEVKYE